jgi:hypothetical protein
MTADSVWTPVSSRDSSTFVSSFFSSSESEETIIRTRRLERLGGSEASGSDSFLLLFRVLESFSIFFGVFLRYISKFKF